MRTEKFNINIAGLTMAVSVDDDLVNIMRFLDEFKSTKPTGLNYLPEVNISLQQNRVVELSRDWKSLFIKGNDIDNLADPFNLIGIAQAIFRFAAIHLAKMGVVLLHGSAASIKGKIICFGDDGSSSAKSLSSLELALVSNKYVADEFCFFDVKRNRIFGYSQIPIHIRLNVKKHIESSHGVSLPSSSSNLSIAGDFIMPNRLFSLITGKFDVVSYVHFSSSENRVERLRWNDAKYSFEYCMASHIAKLLYPELDRMGFASMTDTTDHKIINHDVINEIIKKTGSEQNVLDALKIIISYKHTVTIPCDVVSQLMAEI